MLNESTPPDKLMYTMALYGEDDFGGDGVMDLGDPVLRTYEEDETQTSEVRLI